MTYAEAFELVAKKNQEFFDYCETNDVVSAYGLILEEEKSLEQLFNNAGVFNTNLIIHQNYQNFQVIELLSGLYFVPWGIMAADPEYLKQLPVTEELKKSNLWSVKSVNVTRVDW